MENWNKIGVDIKIYKPPKMIIINLFPNNTFLVHKRNVSRRRFFYAPKTYVFIDSFSSSSLIDPLI